MTTFQAAPAPLSTSTRRPVWLVSLGTGAVACAAGALVAAIAHGAGVPLVVADHGSSKTMTLQASDFAAFTAMCVAIGTVLALLLARFAQRPARTWTIVTVALTLLSELMPLTASHTTTATRLVLLGAHLLAGAIVIPAVAQALTSQRA